MSYAQPRSAFRSDALNINLIDLRDELKFIDSYFYLMKLRHGEGIKINNAIKHNAFSADQPLIIDISAEKDYLVVRNLKQPLECTVESTGVYPTGSTARLR